MRRLMGIKARSSVRWNPQALQELPMRSVLTLMAAAVLATSASLALAQADRDHAAHHPDGASAPGSALKKAPATSSAAAARAASAASGAMGMGMGGANKQQMHDEMHKPGGKHERMHGKDGRPMSGMPAASAASR
jgi:hypothetical protein